MTMHGGPENDQQLLPEEPDKNDGLPFDRRRVLFASLFSLLSTQMMFLNVENILPTYMKDSHEGLNEIYTAIILR